MNCSMPTESDLLEALRQVIDPEVGCNVVDLGLIYSLEARGGKVTVAMTLTTPGCPMHESLTWGVHNVLLLLPGVLEAEVLLVWDPPWSPAMMTRAGQLAISAR